MDYEMETADSGSGREVSDPSVDLEWQVDSEWINLSNPGGSKGNKSKVIPQNFHFIPTSQGGRFLVVDNQTLRLIRTSQTGHSYWVCSMPCCSARCILDPQEKEILRYSGEHNHEADASRAECKMFINALKAAVKENPQLKPKAIYDAELDQAIERVKSSGSGSLSNLPSFESVRTAIYNTRNAILSSLSLKPSEGGPDSEDKAQVTPGKKSRAREAKTKKKSTPTKGAAANSKDLEELNVVWSSEPHKDANLSDFEEWLEEDVNANISSVANLSSTGQGATPVKESMVLPLVISPKKGTSSKTPDSTPSKRSRCYKEAFQSSENSNTADEEGDGWATGWTSSSEGGSKRKYRKRPASSSVFTCPHCPYKSNRHFNVQRHERLAHSTKKPEFSCKECGTSYSLEYRLKLHIKAVHQGEGHHCHICNRTFETMTGLKSHVVTKHKHEDPAKAPRPPPPELTCPLCGRVFSTKAHLQKHTASHVMVQPYRCFMCNKAFLEESSWLTHQSTCREPFTIQCSLCSKVLATPQELLIHMDTAHGRAEYTCTCGKTFPWKKSLLTHQQKCSHLMSDRPTYMTTPVSLEINASA